MAGHDAHRDARTQGVEGVDVLGIGPRAVEEPLGTGEDHEGEEAVDHGRHASQHFEDRLEHGPHASRGVFVEEHRGDHAQGKATVAATTVTSRVPVIEARLGGFLAPRSGAPGPGGVLEATASIMKKATDSLSSTAMMVTVVQTEKKTQRNSTPLMRALLRCCEESDRGRPGRDAPTLRCLMTPACPCITAYLRRPATESSVP